MRIVTLTLNPAYDVHCACGTFYIEKENRADVTSRDAGGKGVNISRALLSSGVSSDTLVLLGDENASEFLAQLETAGLNCLPITVPGRIRENITIHPSNGRETRLSFNGFTVGGNCDVAAEVEKTVGELEPGDVVTMTGSLSKGIPLAYVKTLLNKYRDSGVRVVIDSGAFSQDDLIECRPWLIKPNEEEISKYIVAESLSFEDIVNWARGMNDKGIENVMVSLGKRGAILVSKEGVLIATPPEISAVSTIGAGDSSIAGFIKGTVLGENSAACLKQAVAFGTASCLTPGTLPPRLGDIQDVYSRVSLEKIL
ncbi:MAG: hexose kinase [Clostridia bacterium]|nr:hexose kinase [Clostridia bacterium]